MPNCFSVGSLGFLQQGENFTLLRANSRLPLQLLYFCTTVIKLFSIHGEHWRFMSKSYQLCTCTHHLRLVGSVVLACFAVGTNSELFQDMGDRTTKQILPTIINEWCSGSSLASRLPALHLFPSHPPATSYPPPSSASTSQRPHSTSHPPPSAPSPYSWHPNSPSSSSISYSQSPTVPTSVR